MSAGVDCEKSQDQSACSVQLSLALPRWGWALLIGYVGYRVAGRLFGPLPWVPQATPPVTYDPASLELWGQWLGSHALYMARAFAFAPELVARP